MASILETLLRGHTHVGIWKINPTKLEACQIIGIFRASSSSWTPGTSLQGEGEIGAPCTPITMKTAQYMIEFFGF